MLLQWTKVRRVSSVMVMMTHSSAHTPLEFQMELKSLMQDQRLLMWSETMKRNHLRALTPEMDIVSHLILFLRSHS